MRVRVKSNVARWGACRGRMQETWVLGFEVSVGVAGRGEVETAVVTKVGFIA